MKKSYVIPKGLWALAATALLALGLAGCSEKEPENPTQPYLDILYNGEIDNNLTLSFPEDGQLLSAAIAVSSSRDWKLENAPANWVHVSPATGTKDKVTSVEIKVDPNPDPARTETLVFVTTDGANKRSVVINQAGDGEPPIGSNIYYEDLGAFKAGAAIKTMSGLDPSASTWPSITQYGSTDPTDAWSRGGTVNQSAVTYSGTGSVRNSGPAYDPASGSTVSTAPYVYLSNNVTYNQFAISSVSTGGKTNFTFKVGAQNTLSTASEAPYTPTFGPVSGTTFTWEASFDGTSWATLTYTATKDAAGTDDGWYWASAEFKIPDGTSTLYFRFTYTGAAGSLRLDNFTLTEGGDGALINPGGGGPTPAGELIPIADVRALYTGQDYTFPEDAYTQGSVIVDFDQNNVASLKNLMISDGTSGITVRLAQDVTPADLPPNTEVYVNLKGLTLTAYQGLVQLNNTPNANVIKTGQTKTITPKDVTAAQFITGDYQSMLVKISDVQFVATAVGKNLNDADFKIVPTSGMSATAIEMESKTGDNYPVYVSYYAKFKETAVPDKSGSIIGVGSVAGSPAVVQLMPRSTGDMSGLDAGRFGGDAKYLNVTPEGPVTVPAAGGAQTVNVTANVAWTAEVLPDATATLSVQPSPLSGTGNAAIGFTFAANADAGQKTLTLRVSTTDTGVTTQSYDIVFNQNAAGAGTTYTLVTSATQLTAGAYVFIGKEGADYYTMDSQNAGNYVLATKATSYYGSDVFTDADNFLSAREATLAAVGTNFTIVFNGKYLYANSASANQLQSRDANSDANSEWKIEIGADNLASVVAQGTNSRNDMRFNYNLGTNPRFSCYNTATTNTPKFYIYKRDGNTPPPVTTFGVSTASPVAVAAAGGAQTIAVTGNAAWTAEVVAGNTATYSGLTASGTGAGNISLTIDANTAQTAKTLTVRVSTTAAVTPNSYDIVFNQAAAAVSSSSVTLTPTSIADGKTSTIVLGSNNYGTQSEATPYTWAQGGFGFAGVKVTNPPAGDWTGTIQGQGNDSDATKQMWLYNTSSFGSNIKKVTVKFGDSRLAVPTPTDTKEFAFYAGSSAKPTSANTVITETSRTAGTGYHVYTAEFDLSGGTYNYFSIHNNKVGALYIHEIVVTY